MNDSNKTPNLTNIVKGNVKFKNPNIIIKAKKIKNKELKAIVEQWRSHPELNDTVILDFFLDIDRLIETGKVKISDILKIDKTNN